MLLGLSRTPIFQVLVVIVVGTAFEEPCSPRITLNKEYLAPDLETRAVVECSLNTSGTSAVPTSVRWHWSNSLVVEVNKTAEYGGIALAVNKTAEDCGIALTVTDMTTALTGWTVLEATFDLEGSSRALKRVVWLVNSPMTYSPPNDTSPQVSPPYEDFNPLTKSTPVQGCALGALHYKMIGEVGWDSFDDYAWLSPDKRFLQSPIQLRMTDEWPASRILNIWLNNEHLTLAHIILERNPVLCSRMRWIATDISPLLFGVAAHELLVISAFFTWSWKVQIYTNPPQVWIWFSPDLNDAPRHYAWVFGKEE